MDSSRRARFSSVQYVEEHRRQIAQLEKVLGDERLPLIVAGDFNFTPRMPQWRVVSRIGLRDAHQERYAGRHSTWPVVGLLRYLPGIALDHILVRGPLTVLDTAIGIGEGSDHRPLVARIALE